MNLTAMVLSRTAKMPSGCRGTYRRLALCIVDRDALPPGADEPHMISARARGMVAIVDEADRLHVGRAGSGRCAYSRAEAAFNERLPALRAALGGSPRLLRSATDADTVAAVAAYRERLRSTGAAREDALNHQWVQQASAEAQAP